MYPLQLRCILLTRWCPLVTPSLSTIPSCCALPFHHTSPPCPLVMAALLCSLSVALLCPLCPPPLSCPHAGIPLSSSHLLVVSPLCLVSHHLLVTSPSHHVTFSHRFTFSLHILLIGVAPSLCCPRVTLILLSCCPFFRSPMHQVTPLLSCHPLTHRPCLPWPPRTYISFAKAERKSCSGSFVDLCT